MERKQKGITLIALVITIIVLIIISSISITMLTGENGIIKMTTNTKEEVENDQIDEFIKRSVLAALSISSNNIKYEHLKAELDSQLGSENYIITPTKDANTWKIEAKGKKYKIKNTGKVSKIIESTNGTEPYLPNENFSVLEGTNLNNGLVISDLAGNEYVWIEVPNNRSDNTGPNYTNVEGDMDYDNIAIALQNYAADFRKGAASQNFSWTDKWYAYDLSKNVLISESTEALTEDQRILKNGCGLTYYEYNALYQEMLSSIYSNGGFWIGRYETGIEESYRTIEGEATEQPVIKANAYPYNYVTCSQAQELISKINSGNYTISLMFGIQWDLVMQYLQIKGTSYSDLAGTKWFTGGSTNWGNYLDSTFSITNELASYSQESGSNYKKAPFEKRKLQKALLTTGASDKFSKQNIYDLAGNVYEWVLEYATSDNSYPCVYKGGYYFSTGSALPASFKFYSGVTYTSDFVGFRGTIY